MPDETSFLKVKEFMDNLQPCGIWNGKNGMKSRISQQRREFLNLLRHACWDLQPYSPLFNFWKPYGSDPNVDLRIQRLAEALHRQVCQGYSCVELIVPNERLSKKLELISVTGELPFIFMS